MSDEEPIVLGGYAAKTCPVRIHNDFAPLVTTLVWVPTEEVQADLDAGKDFEAEVFAELRAIHRDNAVQVDPGLRQIKAISATVAAMESGAPLILGGWLPDDVAGGRSGKPDILVKVDGGYLPADVKNHKTVKTAKKSRRPASSLAQPDVWWEIPETTASGHFFKDGMQLAHYTRMLQACGFHPGTDRLFGAIVGTSLVAIPGADPAFVFLWHDLTRRTRPTFSRSNGKVMRSVLECHDHEHRLRVEVATTARRITGSPDDPAPLVVPIGHQACLECPYEEWCADQLGPDDASFAITRERLDVREWRNLRRMGLGTTPALADLDPDDPAFFDEYYPEVTHLSRGQALTRLRAAVHYARMIRDGIDFDPIADTPVRVPAADLEIDFDIEWDTAERIYQWGLRTRNGQDDATARYEPVVSFEPLDDDAELVLAERAAERIAALRADGERNGRTVAIYHWGHVEVSKTRKFERVAKVLDGVTIDLSAWFKRTFRFPREASVKAVAQSCGFTWAVDDPGGRLSQKKIEIARAGGADAPDARQWCLSYNESDVAAQAAIRDQLRTRFSRAQT